MTKIVDLFADKKELKEPKYIEFVSCLSHKGAVCTVNLEPSDWDNLALFSDPKTKVDGMLDIILAWDNNDQGNRLVYFGHWNDGIVEEE